MCSSIWTKNICEYTQTLDELKNKIFENDIRDRIFRQFQVDLDYLDNIDFALAYKCHIPPNVSDEMEFYRVQIMSKNLNDLMEKEREEEKKENVGNKYKPESMMKSAKNSMGSGGNKIPKVGNIKTPKF